MARTKDQAIKAGGKASRATKTSGSVVKAKASANIKRRFAAGMRNPAAKLPPPTGQPCISKFLQSKDEDLKNVAADKSSSESFVSAPLTLSEELVPGSSKELTLAGPSKEIRPEETCELIDLVDSDEEDLMSTDDNEEKDNSSDDNVDDIEDNEVIDIEEDGDTEIIPEKVLDAADPGSEVCSADPGSEVCSADPGSEVCSPDPGNEVSGSPDPGNEVSGSPDPGDEVSGSPDPGDGISGSTDPGDGVSGSGDVVSGSADPEQPSVETL